MEVFDVAVVGAGAAGMMCAAVAGQRGRSVVLIDHAVRPAEKIRISGGGRCNFTNTGTTTRNFLGAQPAFCTAALDAYPPARFVELVRRYRIAFHEKHRGQLFCDGSSEAIIAMLRAECDRGGVRWRYPWTVAALEWTENHYRLHGEGGPIGARQVVVATGGLSIPKIGASDFGYRVARQFGLKIVSPEPALVPLTFSAEQWAPFALLAGVSMPVSIGIKPDRGAAATRRAAPAAIHFEEDLLFTHRGLSGPAILQISSFWEPRAALQVDLVPSTPLFDALRRIKESSRLDVGPVLAQWLPRRLIQAWFLNQIPDGIEVSDRKIAECSNKLLQQVANSLNSWEIVPAGTEGFRKAEVTRGGVDCRELMPSTLESRSRPGLYFVGEVVDVTGWLGGYNFQWAWASGCAAGLAVQ